MKKRTQSFRGRLGISQELMAGYLGISRSMLNMHERYERSLSTAAMVKEGRLQRALDSSQAPTSYLQAAANKEREMTKKEMQAIIRKSNHRLQNAKRRLQTFKEQHEIALNALKVAGILLPTLGSSKADRMDASWLNLLEATAWQTIHKFGRAAQAKLELQIATLAFEMAAAQQAMKE